jgi:hypothetical protein
MTVCATWFLIEWILGFHEAYQLEKISSSWARLACLGFADRWSFSGTRAPNRNGATTGKNGMGIENGVGLYASCPDLASDNKQPSIFAFSTVHRVGSEIQISPSTCVPSGRRFFLVLDWESARRPAWPSLDACFRRGRGRTMVDPVGGAGWLPDPVRNWSSWFLYGSMAHNHRRFKCLVGAHSRFLFRVAVKVGGAA